MVLEDSFFSEPSNEKIVDPSEQTDSEGGGGYTFLFHGKNASEEKKEKKKIPKPGPPVNIHLSKAAKTAIAKNKTNEESSHPVKITDNQQIVEAMKNKESKDLIQTLENSAKSNNIHNNDIIQHINIKV